MRQWPIGLVRFSVVLLAACAGDTASLPPASPLTAAESAVLGQYNLTTSNGATVPASAGTYQINGTTCSRFVDSGFLKLGEQLDQQLSISTRVTCPSGMSTTSVNTAAQLSTGTWSYDGNQLVLVRVGGSAIVVSRLQLAGGVVTADVQLAPDATDSRGSYPLLSLRFQR